MRGSSLLPALGLAGTGLGLVAASVMATAGLRGERILIDVLIGQVYLWGGLSAWARDPTNRTWRYMTGVGLGWYVGVFTSVDAGLVRASATVFADLDAILLIALVLAYPSGRLRAPVDVLIVGTAAGGLLIGDAIGLLTGSTGVSLVVGLAVTTAMGVVIPWRWIAADPRTRHVLAPALVATALTLVAVAIGIAARLADLTEEAESTLLAARDLALLAIPIGFVVGSFQRAADQYRTLFLAQQANEAELRRSRARIVDAGDAARRRLERDLHDGAQQRLVAAMVGLRVLRSRWIDGTVVDPIPAIDDTISELGISLAELRDLASGIHPAVLTEAGLAAALGSLAERSSVPVDLVAVPGERLEPTIEATAYFVASEALANVAKHAHATRAEVAVTRDGGRLTVIVRDDGVGGAWSRAGGGLGGLDDRVRAVGGELHIESAPGAGTTVRAILPVLGPAPSPDTG